MTRKKLIVIGIAFLTLCISLPAAYSAEWMCEVLLCGFEKKVPECGPAIDELRRHLENGWRLPRCSVSGSDDVPDVADIKDGYERYASCEETYGPGFQDYEICVLFGFCKPGCRALKGYVQKRKCDELDNGPRNCRMVNVPQYQIEPKLLRNDPFFIEVTYKHDGSRVRYYYSIK